MVQCGALLLLTKIFYVTSLFITGSYNYHLLVYKKSPLLLIFVHHLSFYIISFIYC